MSQSNYDNNDKNEILQKLILDTQFILETLIRKVSVVEAKCGVKQNYADDELLKSVMFLCNERKNMLIKLMSSDNI